jgi:hypothetical protein
MVKSKTIACRGVVGWAVQRHLVIKKAPDLKLGKYVERTK